MRVSVVAAFREPRLELGPPASADQVVHVAEQPAFARVVPVESAEPKLALDVDSQRIPIVGRQTVDADLEDPEHIQDVPEQLALGPGYLGPHGPKRPTAADP